MTQSRDQALLDLLDRYQRRLPGAEDQLLAHLATDLRDLVCWTLRRRHLELPPDDVEDVVQELLIEAWQIDLPRYDAERGSLRSFLRARVRWRVMDAIRRLCLQVDRQQALDTVAEPGTLDWHPEVLLAKAAEEGRLLLLPTATKASLRRLSQRGDLHAEAAVCGHDLEGQPLRELAARLSIHPSSATRARQRAITHLRQDLPPALRTAA